MCLCHKQDVAPVISTIPIGHKSESDAQLQQQEVLESLTQQLEQLSNEVDQLAADMKQMSVTHMQVTPIHHVRFALWREFFSLSPASTSHQVHSTTVSRETLS